MYKYSFGFKLSQNGKQRLGTWLVSKGYHVADSGWDFVTVTTQVSATHKQELISNFVQRLIQEEQV